MRNWRLFVLSALLSTGAYAQWLNVPTPGTPRTRDGKPNLAAPTPRTAGGKPDLSGVWMHEQTSLEEMKRLFGASTDARDKVSVPGMEADSVHRYALNILLDFKPEDAMMRPEAAKILRDPSTRDPAAVCVGVSGVPLASLLSEPIKIVQSARMTVILHDADGSYRQIYTDGRGLPKEYDLPAWQGYSVGHWERDTLVVESGGFNDKTRLDLAGHPHSEALRVVERYHRRDFGHMDVEMTFDDPRMYTKPFTIKVGFENTPDSDVLENICENERDRAHIKK